jgi:hypothetical protein
MLVLPSNRRSVATATAWQTTFDNEAPGMISIVYGSLVAGLPNNRDALVDGHGRHLRPIFANWLYQLPTLPPALPFSRVKLKYPYSQIPFF